MNYSVNLSSGQTVEVVIGEAAQINVEQALNYIESGRVEITKYVNEWAKPEITNYTNEYAEPIVAEIVSQTTKPLIDDYLNTTTKPQIDEYVADNVKPYADSAKDSAAKAKISEDNAKISEDNAKTSETNAKASELAAASSAGKAVQSANDAKLWAVGTITEKPEGSSKYWAEQAKNALKTPDATETVKGIVRLATSDEVTAGTNDSAAITPLKFKQKIAQDLTKPSADTVPSTKAVSDESSRIVSIMDSQYSNLLSTLYPVGSIYIGTQNSCPLATLIAGSQWQKVATQVVTNVNTGVAVYGNGKTLGLSNGSQNFGMTDGGYGSVGGFMQGAKSVYNQNKGTIRDENTITPADRKSVGVVQDAATSGLTGSLSRTNLSLNIWKRTA